ncbi:Protein hgh1 [Malassezia psittaci]|uniref:Protein HGH1 homolog n=1 Tax=Malassezia psittaci TaxID=1821823 RepID=A0AAF0JF50_9BASI|nr:Protein hgh1 [Malassezia psittaci]
MTLPATHELLQFLADPNPQARQLAMSHAMGFSVKDSPHRMLLLEPLKDGEGKVLRASDGSELNVLDRIKSLCQDQPLTMHDALSALINLTDSPSVALRVGDEEFLQFLVMYIGDSVSLLADLACMLLSNLTKFEPIAARLLTLNVEDRPFYSFLSPMDLQVSLSGMDADPSDPDYEEKKRLTAEATERLSKSVRMKQAVSMPALLTLLRAFEEGASVESSKASAIDMRAHAAESQASPNERPVGIDAKGRPEIRRKSTCNFLASVFANLTVLPKGREFFIHPIQDSDPSSSEAYPVGRIMVYTEHGDLIRRGGVISALKNILFIKHAHKLLLAPAPNTSDDDHTTSPVDCLPYLLMPLIDGKELSKVDLEDQEDLPTVCQLVPEDKPREPDAALRLMLIECLLLLCTSLYGRECLRHRGVYIVVREAHLAENNEAITEAIARLVNLLKREESDATQREAEQDIEAVDQSDDDDDLVIEEL